MTHKETLNLIEQEKMSSSITALLPDNINAFQKANIYNQAVNNWAGNHHFLNARLLSLDTMERLLFYIGAMSGNQQASIFAISNTSFRLDLFPQLRDSARLAYQKSKRGLVVILDFSAKESSMKIINNKLVLIHNNTNSAVFALQEFVRNNCDLSTFKQKANQLEVL